MIQPFSPEGVQDKMNELYALPDEMLIAEADSIRTNLQEWVSDNFDLTETQLNYLQNLGGDFVQINSVTLGLAVEYRLPVILITDPPPPPPPPPEPLEASKLLDSTCSIRTTQTSDGVAAEGQLTYHIKYE